MGDTRLPHEADVATATPDELSPDDMTMDTGLQRLPRGDEAELEEEWSAGVQTWSCILLLLFGFWWFKSKSPLGLSAKAASHGKVGGGGSSSRPDLEEMRRKRMEVLAARAAPPPSSATAAAAEDAAPGLRSRGPRPEEGGTASSQQPAVSTFSVTVRGILHGVSSIHTITGLSAATSVRELQHLVLEAFGPGASGARPRIYADGNELTRPDRAIRGLVRPDHQLQAMFIGAQSAEAPAVSASTPPSSSAAGGRPDGQIEHSETKQPASRTAAPCAMDQQPSNVVNTPAITALLSSGPPIDPEAEVEVRAQGSYNGQFATHLVRHLRSASTVQDLRDGVALAFEAPPDDVALRIFYMGRELKILDATLASSGMKSGAMVNVLFKPSSASTSS